MSRRKPSSAARAVKPHEHSVEAVAAARAAIGPDVALMVDTNCFWDTPEAIIGIGRQFEPYDPWNSAAMRPVSIAKARCLRPRSVFAE